MLDRLQASWMTVMIWGVLVPWLVQGQQRADSAFNPVLRSPAYPIGQGPRVVVDEAHHNFHTIQGRYASFAKLLRLDGYQVSSSTMRFSGESLAGIDVLVIANALHESNQNSWVLPTPSAFEPDEIQSVVAWVRKGGRLLLIADHMPFPGAAEALGRELGFRFGNGYARGPKQGIFRVSEGLLKQHPILDGRHSGESISAVRTFTGQAFKAVADVQPLLVFGKGHEMLLPQRAGRFDENTERVDVSGWYHAATRRLGEGRVLVFGEAALFSAQVSGGDKRPMGLNAPGAEQNQQLCLNVMHWLTGLLEPEN